ncbi:MAG: FHA domain-containing protein [Planctomycetes bacterium]|nr:FHA domain-containing protein [Planctomycetota bacterium]
MRTSNQPNQLVLNQIHGIALPHISAMPDSDVTLGRSPDCCFQLTNRYVSRNHAKLLCIDNQWHLKDLESRSGTYLNTIRMESGEEVQIHNDDLIQIGPWKFLVRLGDQELSLDKDIVEVLDKVPLHETVDEIPTLVRTVN